MIKEYIHIDIKGELQKDVKEPYINFNNDVIIYKGYELTNLRTLYQIKNIDEKLDDSPFKFKYDNIEKTYIDLYNDYPNINKDFCENKIRVIRQLMYGYAIGNNFELLKDSNYLPCIIGGIRVLGYDKYVNKYYVPKLYLESLGYKKPNIFYAFFLFITFQDSYCALIDYDSLIQSMKLK